MIEETEQLFDENEKEYTAYKITTRVNFQFNFKFEDTDDIIQVERRFSQFLWLRNKLVILFSALVIPSLPEKHFTSIKII